MLYFVHEALAGLLSDGLLHYEPPVALVLLPQDVADRNVEALRCTGFPQGALYRPEVLLYRLNNLRQRVLEKVDDSLQVQFGAQDIEEHVLAVALVELRNLVCQLVEHGEGLARVALAGDHGAHLILQGRYLLLELFVLSLEIIPVLLAFLELVLKDFVFIFEVKKLLF